MPLEDRFPRPVCPKSTHYLLHKVSSVRIDERGYLRFGYEDGTGTELLQGPFYPSTINGECPLAAKELAKSRLKSPDEIQYVIAYHCGAFPNGLPVCLLRSLGDVPASYR